MWELILKILEWVPGLLSWVKAPLQVQVVNFSVQDLRQTNPWDPVVVVTPHPRRYLASLVLTNRTGRTVYVKSIGLASHRRNVYKEGIFREPLQLESHEFKRLDVIFLFGDEEEPATGQFEIEIVPSVARKSIKRVTL